MNLCVAKRIQHAGALILIAGLAAMLLAGGCKKDFQFDKVKNLSWNPDIALVLVNDTISLRKILTHNGADKNIIIDESGNISILYYYNNDAFRLYPNDLIKLSPFNFSYLHQVTQAEHLVLSNSDLSIPPVTYSIDLTSNNQQIRVDKIVVKEGTIRVNTTNTFSNAGSLTCRILNATKNGLPFTFTTSPLVNGPSQKDVDISGVMFDLSSNPNKVQIEVEGLLKKSPSPVAGDEIRAGFEVTIASIGRFEGYLGKQTITQLVDSIRVDVFNNAYVLGEIFFFDPQATITIVNSIGIPTEVTIEKLVAINQASNVSLDIANRLGANSVIQVPSPLLNATQPAIIYTEYNNANTGNAMNEFFNMKPDWVAFQVKTRINPNGEVANFFSDTSSFYADLRVKMPLWGHFDHLTYVDTLDLVIDKPEELEHLEFRSKIANGLPLTAKMQVYFTDENYNKKDSLTGTDQIIIKEAPVDPATGLPYPGQFGEKDTIIILNMDRMQNLVNVKKMLVKAVLNSADEGTVNVKMKADQALKITFSARAKLRKSIEINK